MKYGFVIDNRKCIGCHACTTACKSEHEVPVGVNRTWVKNVETGVFPETKRLFSVMRCNHCSDAPCVTICPTEALYTRSDGIVDFDKDRCIGCKSCMQACPYDALYIDPDTNTAAKCNYCAHRIDVGLEPACVNVCPEHAIISGDMENPTSEIAQLLAAHDTKVRKAEKNTKPNLFYIKAEDASLNSHASTHNSYSLWGAQNRGVGHFAKEAEKLAFSNSDIVAELVNINGGYQDNGKTVTAPKSIDVLLNDVKRVYDAPKKGILWGWEVSMYVWTKAIAAGIILIPFFANIFFDITFTAHNLVVAASIGLLFLTITGILLIKDLDRPDRFLYVLLRPHWSSWLVKGGYAISVYGILLTGIFLAGMLNLTPWFKPLLIVTAIVASIVAIYTAFLFAQARARDLWQSKWLSAHMFIHSVTAGAAGYLLLSSIFSFSIDFITFLRPTLLVSLGISALILILEIFENHDAIDLNRTIQSIRSGPYRSKFLFLVLGVGHLVPMLLLLIAAPIAPVFIVTGLTVLIGIYISEDIWVSAPQQIQLS